MPRRREVEKRNVLPDPKFGSQTLSKFMNIIMESGKKAVAEKIVYGALDIASTKSKKDAIEIFTQALEAVKPIVELKSRRVGGATYQVPMPLRFDRAEALAVRWIVDAARKKKGKPMVDKLYEELKAALENTGNAIKKKEDTHKMAEANKAFAHFRI